MNRLTTTVLRDWLSPLVTSGARLVAGRVPDMPNRVITINSISGPGLTMEGLFDVVAFQLSCRGGENNLSDAEDIAFQIDDELIGKGSIKTENFVIPTSDGIGIYVSNMGRTGGPPTVATIPDSDSRWTATCSYFAEVSTNVGL